MIIINIELTIDLTLACIQIWASSNKHVTISNISNNKIINFFLTIWDGQEN